jgi:hypothetical protein
MEPLRVTPGGWRGPVTLCGAGRIRNREQAMSTLAATVLTPRSILTDASVQPGMDVALHPNRAQLAQLCSVSIIQVGALSADVHVPVMHAEC